MRRPLRWVLIEVAAVLSIPLPASAHGIGGRLDLPVPLAGFIATAGVVLVVTFSALAILWPEPRLQTPRPGGAGRRLPWVSGTLGGVGIAFLLLVLVAGIVGVDNASRNAASVVVFVGFWLVVPFVSALVVDWYPEVNPWRPLTRWLVPERPGRPDLVERLGYRPATGVFLAFTWFELLAPDNGPSAIAIATVVFTLYMLGMAWWLGPDGADESADGFAVYNRFLGGISPFGLRDGRWYRTGWLRGLVALPERPGMAGFVAAMIGTVTYDGVSATSWWTTVVREPVVQRLLDAGWSLKPSQLVIGTLGWALVTAAVYGGYSAACAVAARLGGGEATGRSVQRRFAHTLIPIGFAYAFAHYVTLVVFEGQLFLSTMSDPFGLGWNLFGTADRAIDFTILRPVWVWYLQVAVIVLGHVAGVILSHDRALADFPARTAVASQYAMLVLMVLLTGLGLAILAAA